MGDKVKKVFPILLAIWPYTIVVPCFVGAEELAAWFLGGFILFGTLILILNIINAFTYSGENASYELAFWNMLIKLIHIPFYVAIFLMGVLLLLASVVPALIFFTPFMTMLLIIAAAILMITTSMYGINALMWEGRWGRVSIVYMVGMIVMHLCFVLDMIASVILFVQMKQKKSKQITAMGMSQLR